MLSNKFKAGDLCRLLVVVSTPAYRHPLWWTQYYIINAREVVLYIGEDKEMRSRFKAPWSVVLWNGILVSVLEFLFVKVNK